MDITNRIKVHLRTRRGAGAAQVRVQEKSAYLCRNCRNQYYDYHVFCPQCLGETAPSLPRLCRLRVLSVPPERILELGHLLAALTGNKTFAFPKALQSLPWTMMQNTDEGILRQWKEILEAEKAEAEIADRKPSLGRNWRAKQPVFASDAPPPRFFSKATAAGVRHVAQSIQDPLVRLKWVETVLAGFHITEDFYKRQPTHRLLFSDILFHIDHDLQQASRDYDALYGKDEKQMTGRIAEIKTRFDGMASEIREVRQQVEERL